MQIHVNWNIYVNSNEVEIACPAIYRYGNLYLFKMAKCAISSYYNNISDDLRIYNTVVWFW